MKFLIGADPEVFAVQSNGQIVSAHKLNIPGTKKEPFPVSNGAVQVDGTALEVNITPASNADEFVSNITSVLSSLKGMLPQDTSLSPSVTARFYDIGNYPEETRMLGCDPDFDAYLAAQNPPLDAKSLGTARYVGGHVHIGWTKDEDVSNFEHFQSCITLTKQLDCSLYLASLLWDRDIERKQYYGRIGQFRPKPYGVEYRSLSNTWIHDKKLVRLVYNIVDQAIKLYIDKDVFLPNVYSKHAVIASALDLFYSRPRQVRQARLISYYKSLPYLWPMIKEWVEEEKGAA